MTIDKRRPARAAALPAFTPVPRHYNRHDGWTPERQQRFIEALADTGSVKAAAHRVNMAPEGAYQLRRHPDAAGFRKAWEAALSLGVQQLEDLAMERALHGQEVPVYSYGKLIGSRVVYNDRLIMFLLRHRLPGRFAADTPSSAKRGGLNDPFAANRLARLKKQWRKEWAEEQAREAAASSMEVIESINAKLERQRQAWLDGMTARTRALYDTYEQAEREDKEAGRCGYDERREAEEARIAAGEDPWNDEEYGADGRCDAPEWED